MSWQLGGIPLASRLLLGTAHYPSPAVLQAAIMTGGVDVVTVSLRRQQPQHRLGNAFWDLIKASGCRILPNTAGCRSAKEAITIAQMAREIFNTTWIKLEVIGDDYSLQPDPFNLVAAAKELITQGFEVFPYCTEDLIVCEHLLVAGCRLLMPWAAPIGTGKGLLNPYTLRMLRQRFTQVPMIIDAGIGAPSQAAYAMELGFDGILINSAIALAADPVRMAGAFAKAIDAGHAAYQAGLMPQRDVAHPSTPLMGQAFVINDQTI